jgi:hypothetical protein
MDHHYPERGIPDRPTTMRGMAKDTEAKKTKKKGPGFAARLTQIRLAFSKTRELDPKLVPMVLGIPLAVLAVFLLVGLLLPFGGLGLWTPIGIMFALLAAMVIFGRRLTRAQMLMIEGQPGAAAAVLQQMRGMWTVTPAVAFTRNQEFVHRVVGRPGVILVGEGAAARVGSLLKQEQRKTGRVAGDAPVHVVSVGDGADQVPLAQLQSHVMKLPRALKPRDVGTLEQRLGALRDSAPPMPKGPMPRAPRGKRR